MEAKPRCEFRKSHNGAAKDGTMEAAAPASSLARADNGLRMKSVHRFCPSRLWRRSYFVHEAPQFRSNLEMLAAILGWRHLVAHLPSKHVTALL